MSIHNDIRSLTPGALIELFVLDLTQLNGPILRFFAGTNVLRAPIVWQGQAYNPLAVEADGFEFSGGGQLPRPKIRIANKDSAITSLLLIYNDLRGAKVLRRRTFAKYLDAVNFPGGVNTSANPMTAFPDDVFVIDRKVGESRDVVELELTAAFDLVNVQLGAVTSLAQCSSGMAPRPPIRQRTPVPSCSRPAANRGLVRTTRSRSGRSPRQG